MKVQVNFSALGESRWYEYGLRFIFGATITAFAGVIAKKYGATVGGLFLAFPAIFPAAATLIEEHESKKENHGKSRSKDDRARVAAGLDAIGAALGAIGLVAFAIVVWRLLPNSNPLIALPLSTVAWAVVSVAGWQIREVVRGSARTKRSRRSALELSLQSSAPASIERSILNKK